MKQAEDNPSKIGLFLVLQRVILRYTWAKCEDRRKQQWKG